MQFLAFDKMVISLCENSGALYCLQKNPLLKALSDDAIFAHDPSKFNLTLSLLCCVRAIMACRANQRQSLEILANHVKKIASCESTTD